MEVDGSTWKWFVASMEAGATCTDAGLLQSSMELAEASVEVDGSRWLLPSHPTVGVARSDSSVSERLSSSREKLPVSMIILLVQQFLY